MTIKEKRALGDWLRNYYESQGKAIRHKDLMKVLGVPPSTYSLMMHGVANDENMAKVAELKRVVEEKEGNDT